MCLKNISFERIAEEDMIVYKAVKTTFDKLNPKNHGKTFKAIIKGINCKGKLSIGNSNLYFCTNEKSLDGAKAPDKLGYEYSWVFDYNVNLDSLIIGRSKPKEVYKTPFMNMIIKLGKKYTSKIKVIHSIMYDDKIEEGIHSFVKKGDAKLYGKVVKCIIPKGSTFYTGTFNDVQSIASDNIIYGTKIEDI